VVVAVCWYVAGFEKDSIGGRAILKMAAVRERIQSLVGRSLGLYGE
jgi:hypothetical protein